MAGWTEKDIDKTDPEAYQGGQIVTATIKAHQQRLEAEKKRKERLEQQRKLLAEQKARREARSKMATGL
jgi:hypothetical protein